MLVSGEETLPTVLHGGVGPAASFIPQVSNLLIDISITLYVGEPLGLGSMGPKSCKVGMETSWVPYEWPYKWRTGVITPITGVTTWTSNW